jgi:single-strand DNA-binding protein
MNRVMVMGNLTGDPALRRLDSGSAVGELGIAISESYRNRQGEQVESTCYVDVTVWNKTAENCEKYLKKGSSVLVEGRLQFEQWTDREGQKRNKLRVKADRVHFMDPPPARDTARSAAPEREAVTA